MKRVAGAITALLIGWQAGTAIAEAGTDRDDEATESGTAGSDAGGFAPLDGPAPAPTSQDADADAAPSTDDAGAGHRGQVGLAMQLAVGMRGIAPYDGEYCGTGGSSGRGYAEFCFGRSPTMLDLVLSYGLSARLEAILEVRVGLERDFGASASASSGPRPRVYAPGVKAYFSESGKSRLFSTLQIVLDTTGYTGPDGDELGLDWGVRNVNGLQLDLQRALGLYAFLGEIVAWDRWLSVEAEAGLGIQARFP